MHSIAHALDRLYCGHSHKTFKYKENNEIVHAEILKCFDIFYKSIKLQKDNPSFINKSFLKYLNIELIDKEILFFISINDTESLIKYYYRKRIALNNIFKNISDKNIFSGTIDEIMIKLKNFINSFQLFNINYSYIKKESILEMTSECGKIKKVYGCSNLNKKINYILD